MKKKILFLCLALSCGTVHAQLEVTTSGLVNINTPSSPSAQVNIESTHTALKGVRTGSGSNLYVPTLEGQGFVEGSLWNMGVRGVGYGSSGATNCGVFGMSTNGGIHKNYGVMGMLYATTTKGAAIYGGRGWSLSYGSAFTQSYAGYFDGDVHVQGNITFSGNLSGNVLLTSAPPTNSIQSDLSASPSRSANGETTSDLLHGLSVKTYYHPIPEKDRRSTATEPDFTGMDSMEVAAIKAALAEETDEEEEDVIGRQVLSKQHYALDAEQLATLFPDLVYENTDGTKSINYVEMVPVLVQAINELKSELNELKGKGAAKARKHGTTDVASISSAPEVITLGQNVPNPFGTSTSIAVNIPSTVQVASINIYDLNGHKVDAVAIPARGVQTVSLQAANLAEGMYLYSLVADGKVVQTRRMIVEK